MPGVQPYSPAALTFPAEPSWIARLTVTGAAICLLTSALCINTKAAEIGSWRGALREVSQGWLVAGSALVLVLAGMTCIKQEALRAWRHVCVATARVFCRPFSASGDASREFPASCSTISHPSAAGLAWGVFCFLVLFTVLITIISVAIPAAVLALASNASVLIAVSAGRKLTRDVATAVGSPAFQFVVSARYRLLQQLSPYAYNAVKQVAVLIASARAHSPILLWILQWIDCWLCNIVAPLLARFLPWEILRSAVLGIHHILVTDYWTRPRTSSGFLQLDIDLPASFNLDAYAPALRPARSTQPFPVGITELVIGSLPLQCAIGWILMHHRTRQLTSSSTRSVSAIGLILGTAVGTDLFSFYTAAAQRLVTSLLIEKAQLGAGFNHIELPAAHAWEKVPLLLEQQLAAEFVCLASAPAFRWAATVTAAFVVWAGCSNADTKNKAVLCMTDTSIKFAGPGQAFETSTSTMEGAAESSSGCSPQGVEEIGSSDTSSERNHEGKASSHEDEVGEEEHYPATSFSPVHGPLRPVGEHSGDESESETDDDDHQRSEGEPVQASESTCGEYLYQPVKGNPLSPPDEQEESRYEQSGHDEVNYEDDDDRMLNSLHLSRPRILRASPAGVPEPQSYQAYGRGGPHRYSHDRPGRCLPGGDFHCLDRASGTTGGFLDLSGGPNDLHRRPHDCFSDSPSDAEGSQVMTHGSRQVGRTDHSRSSSAMEGSLIGDTDDTDDVTSPQPSPIGKRSQRSDAMSDTRCARGTVGRREIVPLISLVGPRLSTQAAARRPSSGNYVSPNSSSAKAWKAGMASDCCTDGPVTEGPGESALCNPSEEQESSTVNPVAGQPAAQPVQLRQDPRWSSMGRNSVSCTAARRTNVMFSRGRPDPLKRLNLYR